MKQYNNIIVPTDGSVNSKRALEHAVVIASSLGAMITLVYVANIVSVISNLTRFLTPAVMYRTGSTGHGRRREGHPR